MFTPAFVKATLERALRTVAQVLLSLWLVGDVTLNALSINWGEALGVAGGAALVSVLTSVVAYGANPSTGPSLGTEVPAPPTDGVHRDVGAIDVGTAVVIGILVLLVLLVVGVIDVR